MEPIAPIPGAVPEMAEGRPKTEVPQGERPLKASQEVLPTGETHETQPQGPSNAGPAVQLPVTPQLPSPQVDQTAIQPPIMDDNPLVAADDEVIEKEWVQKAKKIVEQTKDDPHTQEKEVSKLQADYIKKRYGKQIKLAGE